MTILGIPPGVFAGDCDWRSLDAHLSGLCSGTSETTRN